MSGYGLFINRSAFKDGESFVSDGNIDLLESGAIGAAATVRAQLGSLETTAAFSTTLHAARTITAVVVDSDIYRDRRTIRLVLSCRDSGFNTKVATSTRLHAKATVDSATTGTANCRPHATTGTCVVALTAPATWINGNAIAVSYGLSSTGPWTTESAVVAPHGHVQLAFTDHFLLTVPAAPVLPGATFPIRVIGRAAQDLESGKFIIVFAGADASQAVVSLAAGISASHSEMWRYQTTAVGNVLTVVINRKPDADGLTDDAQADQEILTANVVLRSSVQPGAISVQLRVLELNAPNPVNPGGGDPIPEDGFVLGHVQGLHDHAASAGNITVASDVAVGLVASVAGGRGTFVNMAPLTGEATSAALVVSVVHRYGAVLRAHASATCSLADESNLGVNVTTGECQLTFDPTSFEPTDEATVLVASDALSASLTVKVWAPELPLSLTLERSISRPIRMGRNGALLVDPANMCRRQYSASQLKVQASFTANGSSVIEADVTDMVSDRLEVSDSTVAELGTAANHTIVVGLSDGVASIGFDVDALGSTELEVDAESYVYIDDFAVDSKPPPHRFRPFPFLFCAICGIAVAALLAQLPSKCRLGSPVTLARPNRRPKLSKQNSRSYSLLRGSSRARGINPGRDGHAGGPGVASTAEHGRARLWRQTLPRRDAPADRSKRRVRVAQRRLAFLTGQLQLVRHCGGRHLSRYNYHSGGGWHHPGHRNLEHIDLRQQR